ncbi:hypothetical protein AYO38_02465 [bacterium SCGC AG-212-C10]|nr:hypothetical protein AYO38_02465 [bacterium SCGC AG-212-C10]
MEHLTGAPLVVAGHRRPYPGESENGDAWFVHIIDGAYRVVLVDGVGHGGPAAHSAAIVSTVLEELPSLDPADVLQRCHQRLHGERGAVVAIAVFRVGERTLTIAGVGNVASYLLGNEREQHLLTQRGLLGSTIPTIRSTVIALPDGEWAFAMHSDGLHSKFTLLESELHGLDEPALSQLAVSLLDQYERADDDASLVLVTPRTGG